jgi:hypothetical protein
VDLIAPSCRGQRYPFAVKKFAAQQNIVNYFNGLTVSHLPYIALTQERLRCGTGLLARP